MTRVKGTLGVAGLVLLAITTSACGDGAGNSAEPGTTSAPSTGPTAFGMASSQGDGFEVSVEVTPDPPRSHQPVSWRMVVFNSSGAPLTVEFSSSMRGDVALLAGEREVYRWSAEKVFAQVLRRDVIAPGESLMFETDAEPLPVEPGEYELTATLVANLQAPPISKTIHVEP